MSIRSLCGAGLMLFGSIVHASAACDAMRSQLEDADVDTLLEIVVDGIDCGDVHRAAVERLETMIARDEAPDELDADDLQEFVYVLAIAKVNAALAQRDIDAARGALRALADTTLTIADAEAGEAADPEVDETIGSLLDHLADVDRVLSGHAPVPAAAPIDTPEPDWMLHRKRCGFMSLQEGLPSIAEAWHAIGRDDVAVQIELSERWIDAMGAGSLPSRLRVYADAAFGDGAFEREWDIALAAIAIEDKPTGRRASMPLFGIEVPLPIGDDSPNVDDALTVWTIQAMREHMRGLVAGLDE